MKSKTIKSVLTKKIDSWCATIKDKKLQEAIKRDAIVTGGAIVSMLKNEPVNDFDIYFKTYETTLAAANYYADEFNSNAKASRTVDVVTTGDRIKLRVQSDGVAGVYENEEDENHTAPVEPLDYKAEYKPVFISPNAITLSDKIQVIVRFYGTANTIHENFDFVHCTCSYDYQECKLLLPEKALLAIMNMDLIYQSSKYPVCAIMRTRKFLRRGWTINAGQYLKMILDCSKLDLTKRGVLEDQLVGVDSLYFANLMCMLSAKDGADLDATYIVSVIEQIFD